jgi:hypothetical protein
LANEIQFPYTATGLTTLTASLFKSGNAGAGASPIANITMSDTTSAGVYWGSVPTTPATAAGQYTVVIYDGSTVVGAGMLNWSGTAEIILGDIEGKTAQLTFTETGIVDANIQYVNDIEVKGTGEELDPWNPVL